MNIVVILLLSALTYSTANESCPGGWIYIEGSLFKFFSQSSVTWDEAKTACENLGSSLAVVDSQKKQDALAARLSGKRHWIGLYRDPEDTSQWLWIDGSRPCCTFWKSGEPNNYGGVFEGCAEMRSDRSGLWNDTPCGGNRAYICELNVCYPAQQTAARKKREELKQKNVFVKKGSARVPVKKLVDGSTA